VDEFLTDEQQAERARQWIRENGVFIAAGVILGLGGLFGWQQWETYSVKVSGEASVVWEQLRSAINGERYNEADELLTVLETDYSSTPYIDQARLAMARMHMDRNSPDEALTELEAVATGGSDPQLRRVAELRMAQVLIYQADYAGALRVLGDPGSEAFVGLYHELRGDTFYAQGNLEEAAAEYRLALENDSAATIDRAFVQTKLDDVTATIASTAPDANVPSDVDGDVLPEPVSE
jgi:predicted negative regulator of RcsB-dependent stress response